MIRAGQQPIPDIGAVLPLSVVQKLAARPGEVTTFGITIQLGKRPRDVARLVEHRFPGVTAVTEPGQVVKVDTSSRLIINAGWIFPDHVLRLPRPLRGRRSDSFFLIGNTFVGAAVAGLFGMGQSIGGERRFQTVLPDRLREILAAD